MAGVIAVLVVMVPAAWLLARRAVRRVRDAEARSARTERMAEIGAMTAGLAHEIKNPLSTISLNAQILSEDVADLDIGGGERSRLVRRLDSLAREVERLSGVLQDYLRFAGEIRLHLVDVEANSLVDEFADFFTPQAQAMGVRVRTDLHARALPLVADASHLKQALLNLALNAVQAMASTGEGGGELIFRTRPAESRETPMVEIHVIDTGPGMTEEVKAKVFTPYFTTKGGGSGLGLPTTRRIVEEHSGIIAVVSEPGRGTDFVVTLPVSPPTGRRREEES